MKPLWEKLIAKLQIQIQIIEKYFYLELYMEMRDLKNFFGKRLVIWKIND